MLGIMPLIYSFVARGTTVLADFTTYTGETIWEKFQ